MAGLPRVTMVQFGSNGLTGTGGFGAAAAGTITTEAASANTLANLMTGTALKWAGGWLGAVLGSSKFPAIEDMNAVDYVMSSQIAYILERGIPEYDAGTSYNIGDICKAVGGTQLYSSLTNANAGNALPTFPYASANWQPYSSSGRIALTGATTFYVATTGNDSTGTGAVGAPWLTIQHAITYLQNKIDFNGSSVTIQLSDGTYTAGASLSIPMVGAGYQALILNGNGVTPSNVIISTTSSDAVYCAQSSITVQNLKMQTTTGGDCLTADVGGLIAFSNVVFGACAASHVNAFKGGQIVPQGNYAISGGGGGHFSASNCGVIYASASLTVTLSGTPAFASAFAVATQSGNVNATSMTFAGTGATGTRYTANLNGIINTNGGGANYFPGNGAGSTATGGQYA